VLRWPCRWRIAGTKNHREALERMLNRLHAPLSALPPPPPAPGDPAAPPVARRPRTLRVPSAREQATHAATRERCLPRYQQVQILVAQGVSVLHIATRLTMSRATVTVFAAATAFPERAAKRAQPRALDPYLPHLQERWQAECPHASPVWRAIPAQGYPGGHRQVARWVRHQRSAPASTTPKTYHSTPIVPPTEVNASRAPPLAAPR
jgi:hypothetical protein